MTRLAGFLILAVYILSIAVVWVWFMARPILAHDAATGWSYDVSCCSGMDCHHVEAVRVQATAKGWRVTLTSADHPMVVGTLTETIAYGSATIKPSQDDMFHVCVIAAEGAQTIRCLYVPLGVMG